MKTRQEAGDVILDIFHFHLHSTHNVSIIIDESQKLFQAPQAASAEGKNTPEIGKTLALKRK